MSSAGGKKVALITGASAGIGEAAALEYAKQNYSVAITGRNEERLKQVVSKLVAVSGKRERGRELTDSLQSTNDFAEINQRYNWWWLKLHH